MFFIMVADIRGEVRPGNRETLWAQNMIKISSSSYHRASLATNQEWAARWRGPGTPGCPWSGWPIASGLPWEDCPGLRMRQWTQPPPPPRWPSAGTGGTWRWSLRHCGPTWPPWRCWWSCRRWGWCPRPPWPRLCRRSPSRSPHPPSWGRVRHWCRLRLPRPPLCPRRAYCRWFLEWYYQYSSR